jgi:tryptophan synthase alpha chain
MGLNLIDFIAPTHSADRVEKIAKNASGFIYLVAYTGITGSGRDEDLSQISRIVKNCSDTPLFVGFGVDEKSAKAKVKYADGVIVGSAFVRILLDESLTGGAKIAKIRSLADIIKSVINE